MSDNSSTPAAPTTWRSWGVFLTSTATLIGLTVTWLAIVFAFLPRDSVTADVRYYWAWLELLPQVGFTKVLAEYPLPAALILAIPAAFSGDETDYLITYVAAMIGAIAMWFAVINVFLPRTRAARVTWAVLIVAMGPMVLLRFDLLPALCVALGLVMIGGMKTRGSEWLTHLVAWGTALKLWPAALLVLLGGRKNWFRSLGVYAGSGAVFVLVSAILGGWSRVFSPLGWQGERGLHCESVLASWITVARIFTPNSWQAEMSAHNSVDFTGPGVEATLMVANLLLALTVAALALVGWRLVKFRRSGQEADCHLLALTATAIIATLIVTNKVFSPQYIMWLLPVWVVVIGSRSQTRQTDTWWGLTMAIVVITFLTQLVFPTLYAGMFWYPTTTTFTLSSVVLVMRNLALVVWTGLVWRQWWQWSAAKPRPVDSLHEVTNA